MATLRSHEIDEALYVACSAKADKTTEPSLKADALMDYLALYPHGAHNGAMAQRVEDLVYKVPEGPGRDAINARFRSLRDPYLPRVRTLRLAV